MSSNPTIVYTHTDEAPALATYSFLPIIQGFTAGTGIEVETRDILRSIRRTVPLAVTMDQAFKQLKEWARDRTRPATFDSRRIDFFRHWDSAPGTDIESAS